VDLLGVVGPDPGWLTIGTGMSCGGVVVALWAFMLFFLDDLWDGIVMVDGIWAEVKGAIIFGFFERIPFGLERDCLGLPKAFGLEMFTCRATWSSFIRLRFSSRASAFLARSRLVWDFVMAFVRKKARMKNRRLQMLRKFPTFAASDSGKILEKSQSCKSPVASKILPACGTLAEDYPGGFFETSIFE
jgi:hypothetical protein